MTSPRGFVFPGRRRRRLQLVARGPGGLTSTAAEYFRGRRVWGRRVGVQLYGTPNPQLVSALEAKGAKVTPVQVYAYGAAADSSSVNALISRILDGQVQVVAFTSAPQVRMLFDFATQLNVTEALEKALNTTVIASIGEVTSRALQEKALTPKIVPAQSKMGAMAQAIAEYFGKMGTDQGA